MTTRSQLLLRLFSGWNTDNKNIWTCSEWNWGRRSRGSRCWASITVRSIITLQNYHLHYTSAYDRWSYFCSLFVLTNQIEKTDILHFSETNFWSCVKGRCCLMSFINGLTRAIISSCPSTSSFVLYFLKGRTSGRTACKLSVGRYDALRWGLITFCKGSPGMVALRLFTV